MDHPDALASESQSRLSSCIMKRFDEEPRRETISVPTRAPDFCVRPNVTGRDHGFHSAVDEMGFGGRAVNICGVLD